MNTYQHEDTIITTFYDYEKARLFAKAVRGRVSPSNKVDELSNLSFVGKHAVTFSLSNQPDKELIQQFINERMKLVAFEVRATQVGYGNDRNDRYGRNFDYQQACAEREALHRAHHTNEVKSTEERVIILFHKIVFSPEF
ncbi:hypothetical protein HJ202_21280 [Vibrio parahaemolyticus]|uniref:hypothetical protein n=1 Tax=Vibrio parahaemolyticus TaxID=670 RepID=UPI001124526B|nr:hypothetical protein [Vibrio parahaemolyticus]MBE3722848.1 hypothetical protein [Vibrio parahaemolyticus]MBE3953551.1 hypothetical protein [Vibrio parahaemolyticus]MBE4199991.1 hypothetical protein [Vibrio parahaemolyticus]MBE4484639.1 hypothetical protein [Vibrio parahaemolyticus]MBE5127416.1 hypothetical protein [Vibrio parahaemolyticus]